jgi:hypothetical protein
MVRGHYSPPPGGIDARGTTSLQGVYLGDFYQRLATQRAMEHVAFSEGQGHENEARRLMKQAQSATKRAARIHFASNAIREAASAEAAYRQSGDWYPAQQMAKLSEEAQAILDKNTRSLHGAGLGDWFCVEGDCDFGRTQVRQLRAVYASAGSPTRFKGAFEAIIQAHDAIEARWFAKRIPFTTLCCDLKNIGVQAQTLAADILEATGSAGLRKVNPDSGAKQLTDAVVGMLKVLSVLAGIGLVVYGGSKVYAATMQARRAAMAGRQPPMAGARRRWSRGR